MAPKKDTTKPVKVKLTPEEVQVKINQQARDRHAATKKTLKSCKMWQVEAAKPSDYLTCPVCKYGVQKRGMAKHITSKAHLKKAKVRAARLRNMEKKKALEALDAFEEALK